MVGERTEQKPSLAVDNRSGDPALDELEQLITKRIASYFHAQGKQLPAEGLYERMLARLEKPLIAATLRATGGNQIKAAEILGLNRNTLRKKMRDLGIDAKSLMQKDAA